MVLILNHPIVPLIITGTDNAKNNDAKKMAVVPPNTLTSANITIAVKEPKITGNKIVKSYNDEEPPNT